MTITSAAAGYGSLYRSESKFKVDYTVEGLILPGDRLDEFKLMAGWHGWVGYMWERAHVALEIMKRDKEEHETGDNYRLEEYIESTIKKWSPARKVDTIRS